MNMDFGANETPVDVIKVILKTFIPVLMANDIESHGKNLMG